MSTDPIKIQLRRDTTAAWATTNPVLSSGEPAYESDTGKVKVGNGTTTWNSLPYIGQVDLTGYATREDLTALSQQKVNGQTYTAKVAELEAAITAVATRAGGSLPLWKASTVYGAGALVVAPTGEIVKAKANHTSASTYAATSWDVTAGMSTAAGANQFVTVDPTDPDNLVISLAAGSPFATDPSDDAVLVVNF